MKVCRSHENLVFKTQCFGEPTFWLTLKKVRKLQGPVQFILRKGRQLQGQVQFILRKVRQLQGQVQLTLRKVRQLQGPAQENQKTGRCRLMK
ncbi:hypothetical protein JOQ06_019294 [Pogonophryne albipinna]|uniref:Uncharacterized protein n=1 Tax=Pogonophryne albipinna TaxID=1090488 RepID=A0AAD6AR66_9TELE|nr:hypothetical protein JOQ06_019294 [Pogonophryne albipinna]